MNTQQIDNLKKLGKEWESADGSKHRIYVDDLAQFVGLKVSYYNSGNINAATLDGQTISNSQAKQIISNLGKVWYDFADDKFHGQDCSYVGEIARNIRARIG
jgi:hypothetical protein